MLLSCSVLVDFFLLSFEQAVILTWSGTKRPREVMLMIALDV